MAFPLWLLLVPYAGITVIAAVLLFFNVFHLGRYGVANVGTRAVMTAYVLGFVAVLAVSGGFLIGVDWSARIDTADVIPIGTSLNPFGL